MAYRDFSFDKVKKSFQLQEQNASLFSTVTPIPASAWLLETLQTSLRLARSSSSEKARSEFIIAPILVELEKRNAHNLAIFSGERLDVDDETGLKGECDFILAHGAMTTTLQAPIFCLVEAKKNDIKEGLGQCVAQMLGARLFNQQEHNNIPRMYGCVTTGEDWQFLKLENDIIFMEETRYYINELDKLLGVLQFIIDHT
jgi:hypothetical protein